MLLSKTEILNAIEKFKHENFERVVINCRYNDLRYRLILLTADCESNRDLMELLGKWRKKNEIWFLSQFEVTTERTTRWFKHNVIEIPDRLLFIIKANNMYIGHVGLFRFDFENKTCEIDNIVRGEPGFAGIMGNAVLHMMHWGRDHMGINEYLLKVLSDNSRALRFYTRLGFVEISRIPLMQVEGKDGPEWTEAPVGYRTDRYYIVMKSVQ